ASVSYAQLQGASLSFAQLQGASFEGAQLHGAWLLGANLQVSLLGRAQPHGALRVEAAVDGADFSGACLWRTNWGKMDRAKVEVVRLGNTTWEPPVPWDAKAYEGLRGLMTSVPKAKMREAALKRIEALDCGNPDQTLASCDPAAAPPPEALDWQKRLAPASVDDAAYAKALASELQGLVCASDANAIHILRGVMRGGTDARLAATGREAPPLIDFILSKDCPVSAALTEGDKARLLR